MPASDQAYASERVAGPTALNVGAMKMATNRRARGAWPRKRKLSMQIRPKVCLELGEWESLAEIASWEHTTVASLVRKQTANTNMPRDIKKALREFVVDYLRKRAARLLGH